MIPLDFAYYKPDSAQEALQLYRDLDAQGKRPVYYNGGTEIISMARKYNVETGAVIDLKGIFECNVLGIYENQLVIGGSVTLSKITESNLFPLLGKTAGRIADHTVQCKITIAGNICATIIYREMALPLLLSDAQAVVASLDGTKKLMFRDVFKDRISLGKGEFVQQFLIDQEYLSLPYIHVKKTKSEKVDYPLLTMTAIKKDNRIRVAASGLVAYPFRSDSMEEALNEKAGILERVDKAMAALPQPVLNDILASDRYRKFVTRNTLINVLSVMEGVQQNVQA